MKMVFLFFDFILAGGVLQEYCRRWQSGLFHHYFGKIWIIAAANAKMILYKPSNGEKEK